MDLNLSLCFKVRAGWKSHQLQSEFSPSGQQDVLGVLLKNAHCWPGNPPMEASWSRVKSVLRGSENSVLCQLRPLGATSSMLFCIRASRTGRCKRAPSSDREEQVSVVTNVKGGVYQSCWTQTDSPHGSPAFLIA